MSIRHYSLFATVAIACDCGKDFSANILADPDDYTIWDPQLAFFKATTAYETHALEHGVSI